MNVNMAAKRRFCKRERSITTIVNQRVWYLPVGIPSPLLVRMPAWLASGRRIGGFSAHKVYKSGENALLWNGGSGGIAGQDTGIGVAGAGRVSVRINGEWPGVTEKKTYCCHLTPLGMHIVIVSRVLRHRLLLVNWGSRGVHGGCGGP